MWSGSVWVRPNLFWRSSRRGVSDRPSSFFPGPELGPLQNINQHWEDVGINHCLWSGRRHDQRVSDSSTWERTMSKADHSGSLLLPVSLLAWSQRLTWICALFPAVMLEMVQHASFFIDSFGLLRRCSRQGRAEQFNTTWNTNTNLLDIISDDKCEVQLRGCNSSFSRSTRRHSPSFLSHLGLNVIACDDVSYSSQRRRSNLVVSVPGKTQTAV